MATTVSGVLLVTIVGALVTLESKESGVPTFMMWALSVLGFFVGVASAIASRAFLRIMREEARGGRAPGRHSHA